MQVEVEIDANANARPETEVIKENPLEAERSEKIQEPQLETENESDDSSYNDYGHSEISEDDESFEEEKKTIKIKKEKPLKKDKEKIKKQRKKRNVDSNEQEVKKTSGKKKWTDKFLDPILTEQMIKKHIKMICDLCVFVGSSFPDMVSHFKKYHPKVRPYIMCCDRKFTKRYYVAQHALKHEDPNYFR